MTRRIPGPRRAAFTMIELLVVILIITILAAILLPAVNKVRQSAKRATAVSEINQMANGIAAFKTKYHVTFVPSTIVLRENMDYTAADVASQNYLLSVWPHLLQGSKQIDWNGDGTIAPAGTAWTLEGDQCLVFFLGGIPTNGGGFSSNPTNPASTTGRGARFYEFQATRLAANGNPASGSGFLSYIDPWNTHPYVFFSSNGKKNGYSATDCNWVMTNSNGGLSWGGPYQDTATSFFFPTGFQIISAGQDGLYGVGGRLTQGGLIDGAPGDADNMVNFLDSQLGGY